MIMFYVFMICGLDKGKIRSISQAISASNLITLIIELSRNLLSWKISLLHLLRVVKRAAISGVFSGCLAVLSYCVFFFIVKLKLLLSCNRMMDTV